MRTHDRVAIRSGHGVGKTALESWFILWFLLTHYPCKIPVTANSADQLRDVTWAELAKWLRVLPEELSSQFEINTERLFLKAAPGECFAVSRTASRERPEALQGFHAEHLAFVIEEASGIPDSVFEVAQGALSTPGAKVLMCGNPTRLSGFFYDSFHRAREKWFTLRVSSEEVPRARGHIEDIITRYGQESNAYRVRVQGEFPTTEDEQVIPLELIEAAVGRDVEQTDRYRAVWGLDVARFGDDRTALAKRQGNILLGEIKSWKHKDTMQVVGLVKADFEETPEEDRPSEILVDVIGLGAGVVDRLREQGLPARGVNVGESASVKERYNRLRDELWFRGREWFEKRDCVIPDDATLIKELAAPRYEFLSNGKIIVESKQDMKSRGQPSPDVADAFLLTLAGGLDEKDPFDSYRKDKRRKRKMFSWMAY